MQVGLFLASRSEPEGYRGQLEALKGGVLHEKKGWAQLDRGAPHMLAPKGQRDPLRRESYVQL